MKTAIYNIAAMIILNLVQFLFSPLADPLNTPCLVGLELIA